jgi:hypothetical protein
MAIALSDVCFRGKSGHWLDAHQCPLLTQSGHGSGSLGITTGGFSIQKYDILFIPDVVLGAGKAMRRRESNQTLQQHRGCMAADGASSFGDAGRQVSLRRNAGGRSSRVAM